MNPHATARLYTQAEVAETQRTPAACELDARYLVGLAYAVMWQNVPQVHCAMCNAEACPASYLIVLMPSDERAGFGTSGVVCSKCAQNLPRERLQQMAEMAARVMFEPAAGHA